MDDNQRYEILERLLRDFSNKVREAADEAISEAEVKILPYALSDTSCNAMFQAHDIVKALMEGRFEHDGDYLVFDHPRDIGNVRMKFSDFKYDLLRDRIIERMTICPKDAKIAALEDELKRAYESRY